MPGRELDAAFVCAKIEVLTLDAGLSFTGDAAGTSSNGIERSSLIGLGFLFCEPLVTVGLLLTGWSVGAVAFGFLADRAFGEPNEISPKFRVFSTCKFSSETSGIGGVCRREAMSNDFCKGVPHPDGGRLEEGP